MDTQVTFDFYDADETGETEVSRSVVGEAATSLPELLAAFRYFLHGAGFPYVTEIEAVTMNAYGDADSVLVHSSAGY